MTDLATTIDAIVRQAATLPDRLHLPDQPEVLILTESELRNILWHNIEYFLNHTDNPTENTPL